MTDNEITKAFECCSYDDVKKCDDCPYYEKETKTYCVNELIKDTLDLINRQKAEIERLQNERIERIRELTRVVYDKEIAEAKAEAIKEFAERFRKKANMFAIAHANPTKPLGYEMDMEYRISKSHFDNLVKEMAGD